ncbi:MAG: hypothetical protein ACYSX0_05610 [Planctomycetota bacterium]
MRVLLAVFFLGALAHAESGEPTALDRDIDSYMKARQVEQEWGYDRYQVEAGWNVHVVAGLWRPDVRAPVSFKGNEIFTIGEIADFLNGETSPLGRVTVGYDIFELIFDYSQLRIGGSVRVQEEFTIDGETFQVDETLNVDLRFQEFRIVPGFRIWRSEPITVTLLAALCISRLQGDLTTTRLGTTGFDEILPVPMLGVKLTGRRGRLVWAFEALGLKIDLDVFGGGVLDLRLDVGYAFTKNISVRIGYRYADVEGFYGDLKVRIESHGPYLSAVVAF